MEIIIKGLNSNVRKLGDTRSVPIPRIGDRIEVGNDFPPVVKEVVYNFELNSILIIIDGKIPSQ